MRKKYVYSLLSFLLLTFLFSLSPNASLMAQEQEEAEDVMDMALEDLLNVEITTAGKQAEKIGEIPASVVVVTREDIEKYGYQSLVEVLDNIPGLYHTEDYYSKSYGVRGFWTADPNRNVIILVNDVPQVDDRTSAFWLKQINVPVEAIDRIEVVRGPMSVIYGTGAFFGVINIKTNIVDEKAPISQVSASYGSDSTFKAFARSAGKSGDFQYAFNAGFTDSAGLNEGYADSAVPATLTTEDKLELNNKYFNFSGTFKDFYFDASYAESRDEFIFLLTPPSKGSEAIDRSVRVSFGFKKKLSEKLSVDAKLGYYIFRLEDKYEWIAESIFAVQTDGSSGLDMQLNLFFEPSEKLNITFGLSYHKAFDLLNSFDVPALNLLNRRTTLERGDSIVTQAIYSQLNFKFSEKFKIVAGARVEQSPAYSIKGIISGGLDGEAVLSGEYKHTDAEFIPRVAFIFMPNEKHSFKLLYGKAINRPSFFQNRDFIFVPGSIQLEPETIQTFELNYIGSLSSKFTVSLSLFRNMLDKLIFRSISLVNGVYRTFNDNVGEMTTNGAELTIRAALSSSFQLELSGTYQDTKDERDGLEDIDVGYAPKFLGYIKASYFFNKDISLAITGNYVDEMESYYDDNSSSRLGEKVDSYFLLGANLRVRKLFGTGLFLNLRCSNLLDEEVHYPATANSFRYAEFGTLGRGLSFLCTLGWRF